MLMLRSAFVLVVVLLMSVVPSAADSPHFIGTPTCTDIGTQLVCSGSVAGLGNGDVTVIATGQGIAEVECTNPAGNVAPGQDTAVTSTGTQTIEDPKNGRIRFSVVTQTPSISSSVCPNNQWTATAIDVDFSSFSLTFIQNGQVVLTFP